MEAGDHLAEVIRIEGARLQATLVRALGDWSLAEEAVQEAAIAALRDWAVNGLPDEPRAWLTATARRKAIDIIRRERARDRKERAGVELMELSRPDARDDSGPDDTVLNDDLLRLIFTCCHPSLAPEARLALALRTLCQLSVAQVAAALLTTEVAMSKRLTRTRQKIALAKIPYRVPADAELPERLATVCGVVHALYTAGHAPVSGDSLVDIDLCREGLRLSRLLHQLLPDEAMPAAVLALIVADRGPPPGADRYRGGRRAAVGPGPDPMGPGHDHRGSAPAAESLRRTEGIADPYQLQAAIAAEHDRAADYPSTDWAEIIRLYDLLVSVAPSDPARLSRAVAVAEHDGPEAGLRALDGLRSDARTEAVRSELLARAGRFAEAVVAGRAALNGELTEPERRFRQRRLAEWVAASAPASLHGLVE